MKIGSKRKLSTIKKIEKSNIVQAKFDDITNDYVFEKHPIGKGGFGEVYLTKHNITGEIRAIKHIKLKANLKTVNDKGNIYSKFVLPFRA